MDARMRSALDRWITSIPLEEDWEDDSPVCQCGESMGDPVKVLWDEDTVVCSGKVIVLHGRWGDSRGDEGILRIIGEDKRGEEWEERMPACSEYGDAAVDHDVHNIVYNVRQTLTFRCGECGTEQVVVCS